MENNQSKHYHADCCSCCSTHSQSHSHEHHHDEHGAETGEHLRIFISGLFFIAGVITFKVYNRLLFGSLALPSVLFIFTWFISGFNVIRSAIKNIGHGQVFDENFLMTLASAGAFIIGEYFEGATVMLLYNIGEMLQDYALRNSRRSISDLLKLKVDTVRLLDGGVEKEVAPADVPVGSVILIKPGEKIPIDGMIEEGSALVETASLTGESVPKSFTVGEKVFSGFISLDGALKIRTEKLFSESAASKVAKLIEQAQTQKAQSEKFITRFARVYTPMVTLAALCLAVLPPIIISVTTHTPITGFGNFVPWFYRGLIFLTVSCPCALVISIPLTYFAGLGGLAKKGILVKGANFVDSLSKLSVCVFDKTGTLTESKLTVSKLTCENGFTETELLQLAVTAEKNSSHPIAHAVLKYAKTHNGTDVAKACEVKNFAEISGKGVRLEVDGKELLVGNEKIFSEANGDIAFDKSNNGEEKTSVYVIYDQKLVGTIFFSDRLRDGALTLTKNLKAFGVQKTVILTGDNATEAKKIATQLGIDEFYASLLPEEKLAVLKNIIETNRLQKEMGCVSFMGDGINDAPALSLADVGIGFANVSSDLALESADLVFLNEHLNMLPIAMKQSKKITKTVTQNIVFAIGVKVIFLGLGAFGLVGMIPAIFADMGVCLLAILNSLRARY